MEDNVGSRDNRSDKPQRKFEIAGGQDIAETPVSQKEETDPENTITDIPYLQNKQNDQEDQKALPQKDVGF